MASPPPVEFDTDGGAVVELDEEIEGDEFGTRNYRFSKIGEDVPLNSGDASEFERQSLPSQPVAVSERFRLLFVAHPQGFYVVRTKDVMASAEEIKEKQTGPSIEKLSIVDVPIGKVSILALSADDSLLAATVASHVHFFAVSALLHKEQKPSYSVSLDDPICINDVRWARNAAKSYLILSSNGKLYHGSGQGPLTFVMEGVHSVDWSIKGNFVAVAKKNAVSILSLQFKEIFRFLLSFQSVIGSDPDKVIKVDSIRWIRPDSIAVGCFQLNDDGEEENYIVQVITSRGRRITDASEASKPIVLSFNYLFMDFSSDAVPTRNGPHLFLSYLDLYGLAFVANRNLSRQVSLFYWQDSGKNEAAMVDILNDAWTLHIDSQANGDDNVIVGLSVDKVSQNENVRFTLGDEEKEVSPCCVIICLTIDGKISVFHFTSAADTVVSPEGCASGKEDDASQVSVKQDLSLISAAGGEESREPTFAMSQANELSRVEVEKTSAKVTVTNDLSPPLDVDIRAREQTVTENLGQKPLFSSLALKVDDSEKALSRVQSQGNNAENQSISEVKHSKGFASSEEDDASQGSVTQDLSLISAAGGEGSREPTFSMSQSNELSRVEVEKTSAKATVANDLSSPLNQDIRAREQTVTENLGQKPLFSSQALKVDDSEKALSRVQSQDNNAENQSISEVKHSKGFFTGKVAGDSSRQSVNNYPLLGSNVEPLHKVPPPTNTPSVWSVTTSSAKGDASKTSDGRFLSFPFDKVDNSDKHTLRYAGDVQQHPTDLKEKPSVSFTSSGQTAFTAQGNKNSQPYPGSQVPLGNSFASGKSFQSEIRKELNAASSPTSLTRFVQNASKHVGNVEEMAKKMDILLEGIEGKGGFIDASITSQKNSVLELEEGIWALSDRCRIWRGLMNEQQRELQLLLDKTVEVLVRKLYVEGIFKQATDGRYWELWNRQKLSSELELKQRRILELNQELTNKLIELERHFNSLEFNKFRENEGVQRNRRALQNWHGRSRQIQSLHSLHNTMTAQLAAAEQLSGCLSKQMAALSIESSGKHDVKRQLFESIGLPYAGDTEISPARNKISDTPTNKGFSIISGSIGTKGQSRRNQASFAMGWEPETARQRRDSFDRSWASLDPPKTTLKRMLKEDYEKGSSNRSFLNINKEYFSPQSQKKSEFSLSAISKTSGASQSHYKSKGIAEASAEQFSESRLTSLYHRTAAFQDRGVQESSTKGFSALSPPSIMETKTTQNSEPGALKLADEKSKSSLPFSGKNYSFAASDSNLFQQSDTSIHPLPSISAQLPDQSLTSPSDSSVSLDRFKVDFTKSTSGDQKNPKIVFETPSFDAKVSVPPASAFSSAPNVSEKGLFRKNSEKMSLPNDGLPASSSLQSVLGSPLPSSNNNPSPASLVSKPNSSTVFPATSSSSEASVVAKQEASQPQTSVTPTLKFPSALPSSTFSSSSSSSIVKSESLTSSSQPSVTMYSSKTERIQTKVDNKPTKTETGVKIETLASQPELAISTSGLKLGLSAPAGPTEWSTKSESQSQDDLGGSSKNSLNVTSVIRADTPFATEALPTVTLSSEGVNESMKSIVSNSSDEEEMEEEAPETDQTSELSLANLSGFGIGPTQNSTTPKANPFGVAVLNNNITPPTSSYTMSGPSGQLFRPASFSFQPPKSPEPLQQTNVNFSVGFSSGAPGQVPVAPGFGQPAQVGVGQQALGSVLGSFGQSRQIGTSLPGSNVAPASGYGSGFTGISASGFGGGFTSASPGGGFASLASGTGGFASLGAGGGGFAAAAAAATAGGGFAAAATAGGGFAAGATAGGGFAPAAGGGGFGAFSNQQGGGGSISAFGGGSGTGRPPSELFTQMRK